MAQLHGKAWLSRDQCDLRRRHNGRHTGLYGSCLLLETAGCTCSFRPLNVIAPPVTWLNSPGPRSTSTGPSPPFPPTVAACCSSARRPPPFVQAMASANRSPTGSPCWARLTNWRPSANSKPRFSPPRVPAVTWRRRCWRLARRVLRCVCQQPQPQKCATAGAPLGASAVVLELCASISRGAAGPTAAGCWPATGRRCSPAGGSSYASAARFHRRRRRRGCATQRR